MANMALFIKRTHLNFFYWIPSRDVRKPLNVEIRKEKTMPGVRRQSGLYSRPSDRVTTTMSGRVSRGAPTFTQDVHGIAYVHSNDLEDAYDDEVEDDEEEERLPPSADPIPRDTEGYSVTAYGDIDPEGLDKSGYTRSQNAAWEASQHGFGYEDPNLNRFRPSGFYL